MPYTVSYDLSGLPRQREDFVDRRDADERAAKLADDHDVSALDVSETPEGAAEPAPVVVTEPPVSVQVVVTVTTSSGDEDEDDDK